LPNQILIYFVLCLCL